MCVYDQLCRWLEDAHRVTLCHICLRPFDSRDIHSANAEVICDRRRLVHTWTAPAQSARCCQSPRETLEVSRSPF